MRIATGFKHAAHRLAFLSLKYSAALAAENAPPDPVRVMGLSFPGRVGAAAGLDRYGEFAHLAHRLGLGFVETGTVTPRREPGANRGLDALLANLCRQDRDRRRCRVGISIAANASTPLQETWRDLCACMERAWDHADYFTLNLGSRIAPLTRRPSTLRTLLETVKNRQRALTQERCPRAPVIVKLHLSDEAMGEAAILVETLCAAGLDGVLAAVAASAKGDDGARLTKKMAELAAGRCAIISVGGIRSPQEACARMKAGAMLLQLHHSLLRPRPRLLGAINTAIATEPTAPAVRTSDPFSADGVSATLPGF
jgi:dihydroorotate dehydrogenase